MPFFVNQKQRKNEAWNNNVHVKETINEALHQFHAFMSTYAYGQDKAVDYASCSVETIDGRIVKSEVDDRIPAPEPEEE